MNLTIEELERRLYIDGRTKQRAILLAFEHAWDDAEESLHVDDATGEPEMITAEDVFQAPLRAWRPDV